MASKVGRVLLHKISMLLNGLHTRLFCLLLGVGYLPSAFAEIYEIKNRGGSVTYTSRKPAFNDRFQVFRPKGVSFNKYAVRGGVNTNKLFLSEFRDQIHKVSKEIGVDSALIRAVIHAESAFNPKARSPKGAMGLMQLMPATAKEVGVKNPWEPKENIQGGARYLAWLLSRYKGDLRRAVAAYNAGPDAVDTYQGIPPYTETQEYVRKVIALHQAYRNRSS